MAVRSGDAEALHLFELIGAPLLSVIQAEAQAAQTSAEFIQRVGFDPPLDADAKQQLQDGKRIGNLKVAEFDLSRPGPDGQMQTHTVSVPVLSLFPIPLLQVKHAEFEFDIRVLSRVPIGSAHAQEAEKKADQGQDKDFLAPERVELKGFLEAGRGGQASNNAHLKVKVRMEQSDLPAGLIRLMSLMEQNVSLRPVAKTPGTVEKPPQGSGNG